MKIKPFREVMVGDMGEDYAGEKGTIIAKGNYESLQRHDSTGACEDLEEDQRNELVAIVDEFGDELVYVYGSDGFSVEEK
jgi:hypothetical protein